MGDTQQGVHLTQAADIDRLPSGSLIEGFDALSGGYWHVDPAPLAEKAALLILEEDKDNRRPAFHSKAAVVHYAVKHFDFEGRRTHYENLNEHIWQERIRKYQTPKSESQAVQFAKTLAYKEFSASMDEETLNSMDVSAKATAFNAYLARPEQERLLEERSQRFQQSGPTEEEALLIAPDPRTSDTPAGLVVGPEIVRPDGKQRTDEQAARLREQVEGQLRAEGRHKAADRLDNVDWRARVSAGQTQGTALGRR